MCWCGTSSGGGGSAAAVNYAATNAAEERALAAQKAQPSSSTTAASANYATSTSTASTGSTTGTATGLHIGAIAFIHRFGSSLNEHVHFHVCVVDGVFEEVEGEGDADATPRISSPGVIFHAATGIDAATVAA